MARRLGLAALLDRRPSRCRDLALALIAARVLHPCSKLATARTLGQSTLGAPLLYRDEAPPARTDPVLPPGRSAAALAKERDHRTPDGLPVGSFATLLAELATLTRNRVVPTGAGEGAAFELLSEPTPLQARAFELIGVSPGSL